MLLMNQMMKIMLLTKTQISKLRKAFAHKSLANIKLSKTQLYKIEQSRVF